MGGWVGWLVGWLGESRGKRRGADRTSRLKEILGCEGIRDSADIRSTDIRMTGILLNVAGSC